MKSFKSVWLLIAVLSLFAISCQKNEVVEQQTQQESSNLGDPTCNWFDDWEEDDTQVPANIVFTCLKTVPLCTSSGVTVGEVTIKTGSDGKLYVTYKTTGQWYLVAPLMFAGNSNNIPMSSGIVDVLGFPLKKLFPAPYTGQEYTFGTSRQSDLVTVAAYAYVVKKVNGIPTEVQHTFADACSGTLISSGNWATKVNYSSADCVEEFVSDLCSYQPLRYFGLYPYMAWPDVNYSMSGVVTVGGYFYSEGEGRNIYNCVTLTGADAQDAFKCIATLKLSKTNYNQGIQLLNAVNTVESWLATKGKLSILNLPAGNQSVRDAITYIEQWIKDNPCADR